jgi:hypothetical protein
MRTFILFVIVAIDTLISVGLVSLIKVYFIRRNMFFSNPTFMVTFLVIGVVLLIVSLYIHFKVAPYLTNVKYLFIMVAIMLSTALTKI